MLLGYIMDRYGCRLLRLVGVILFLLSTVMLTFISWYPKELEALLLLAVAFNGVGGESSTSNGAIAQNHQSF